MNLELLKDAYAIIEGMPDERIDLDFWQDNKDVGKLMLRGAISRAKQIDCGTIACAAGWLSLHPDMNARGLVSEFGVPEFRGDWQYEGLAKFFDISLTDAGNLFKSRSSFEKRYVVTKKMTDRQLWLWRVRRLIGIAITSETEASA